MTLLPAVSKTRESLCRHKRYNVERVSGLLGVRTVGIACKVLPSSREVR